MLLLIKTNMFYEGKLGAVEKTCALCSGMLCSELIDFERFASTKRTWTSSSALGVSLYCFRMLRYAPLTQFMKEMCVLSKRNPPTRRKLLRTVWALRGHSFRFCSGVVHIFILNGSFFAWEWCRSFILNRFWGDSGSNLNRI